MCLFTSRSGDAFTATSSTENSAQSKGNTVHGLRIAAANVGTARPGILCRAVWVAFNQVSLPSGHATVCARHRGRIRLNAESLDVAVLPDSCIQVACFHIRVVQLDRESG